MKIFFNMISEAGRAWQQLMAFPMGKYILVLLLFGVWMMFFDKHRIFTQVTLWKTVKNLNHDIELYSNQIEDAKIELENFKSNREKFAREKYFMHLPNEEVYLIDESDLYRENKK